MGADDLLCAACGGRVGDARCPTCRASLAYLREQRPHPAGPVLVALLLILLVLSLHLAL